MKPLSFILGCRVEQYLRAHRVFHALERTDMLRVLRGLVESGKIKLRVTREYAPEEVAEAQRALMAGGLRGRPVIVF